MVSTRAILTPIPGRASLPSPRLTVLPQTREPLAMATLVKSSDLPTLSIRLIMQGKVTEILVTPPTTFHPLASQPQPPNPTLELGLCLVKPEVWCQLVPNNNKHPFDHFQLFSMSFMFRRYSLAVALCVFQTRDCLQPVSMFNLVSDTNSLFGARLETPWLIPFPL